MSTFTKLYDAAMSPLEKLWLTNIRRQMLKNLSGRVLELGAGTGANFPYYPERVYVKAIEPSDDMRMKALKRAENSNAEIEVVDGRGEWLICPDKSYDYAVATLVLCSVEDPLKVIKEMHRILKPGGKILLFEHVKVENPFWSKVQDRLTPTWAKLCDNCQLNRDTVTMVRAIFKNVQVKYYFNKIFVEIIASK